MSARTVQKAVNRALVGDALAELGLDRLAGALELMGYILLPVRLPSRHVQGRTRLRLVWRGRDGEGMLTTIRYSRTVRMP
jgi:hypothetical protein